jgi:multidrug efflux system outer membrane protein
MYAPPEGGVPAGEDDFAAVDAWWRGFGDETTSMLVEQALENNTDLAAASARVMQAAAVLTEISGRQWPEISYAFDLSRDKRSFKFGPRRFSNLATTYSHAISVSYVVDLFGRLRHATKAAAADLLAAEAARGTVVNSLVASVVKSRVEIATLQRRLAIARADSQSRQKTLDVVERRYAHGLVPVVDVRLARENLEASKAAGLELDLSLATARNALAVLLGKPPAELDAAPETLPDLPDLGAVPVGIPAQLLRRRPDVRSAELALIASNDRIGVRIAELYPDLTLSASLGNAADRWRDMWIGATETYGAAMHLAQPFFKGRQLQARVRAERARFDELAADYGGRVLAAIGEVEDALYTERVLREMLVHVRSRLEEAGAAERLTARRYEQGVESILTTLDTQRRRRAAEEQLAVLRQRIWNTRINVFLAIGGDWEVSDTDGGDA